jgi:hypothetical protein
MIHPLLDACYTRAFFRDRLLCIVSILGLAAHAALWFLLFLGFDTVYSSDREYITLHYKVLFGADSVAQWFFIFLLPLGGLAVVFINFVLARALYHIDRRYSIALQAVSCAANAVLIAALYFLLQVNLY